MNEFVKEVIRECKKHWYIVVLILMGILMMLKPFGSDEQTTSAHPMEISEELFIDDTEKRIVEMLKSVKGAGTCEVTVALASGGRKEYVREEANVLVVKDKDGNESAVLAKENAPEIAGVTVASVGAGNITVRGEIIH